MLARCRNVHAIMPRGGLESDEGRERREKRVEQAVGVLSIVKENTADARGFGVCGGRVSRPRVLLDDHSSMNQDMLVEKGRWCMRGGSAASLSRLSSPSTRWDFDQYHATPARLKGGAPPR